MIHVYVYMYTHIVAVRDLRGRHGKRAATAGTLYIYIYIERERER